MSDGNDFSYLLSSKKVREKVQGVLQSQAAALSQTLRGRGNRQNQTSANRTNVQKALRLASSLFPKQGNRNAQRTEKHKNKITPHKT